MLFNFKAPNNIWQNQPRTTFTNSYLLWLQNSIPFNILLKMVRDKAGLGFLEVIIALSVLLTGVVSGLTLTTFNFNTTASTENRLVAVNLAREGLEVFRGARDSAWLAGTSWLEVIFPSTKKSFVPYFNSGSSDGTTTMWSIEPQDLATINDCATTVACQIKFYPSLGRFIQSGVVDLSSYAQTTYKRLVIVRQICYNSTTKLDSVLEAGSRCASSGLTLIGYELESQVGWLDQGKSSSISLIDRLYDWK